MGNDASLLNHYDIARFYRKQDWLQLAIRPRYQLWKHKFTHQTAEVYILHQPPSIQDMDSYEFRSKQQELVKVFFIDVIQEPLGCDVDSHIKLIVEHIPTRLSDIKSLTQEEALTIFQASLKGFRALQKRFEPIEPKTELIGFNSQGKTKVWLNKHLEVNIAEAQHPQFVDKYNQRVRINKLLNIIQQKTVGVFLPNDLKQQFLSNIINYDEALASLRRFAYTHALSLSIYVDSRGDQSNGKSKPIHLRHARQDTNSSLQSDIREHKYFFTAKIPQQLQKTVSSTNLSQRVQFNRTPQNPLSSSQSFYRIHCPSADYSLTHNVRSSTFLPHPKVNFVNSTISNKMMNNNENLIENNNEQSRRKYTIIDKIKVDFQAEEKSLNRDEKTTDFQTKDNHKLQVDKQKVVPKHSDPISHKENKQIPKQLQIKQKQQNLYLKSTSFRIVRVESLCQNITLTRSQDMQKQEKSQLIVSKKESPNQQKLTHKKGHTEDQDFLDINFLERSLERKFKHQQDAPHTPHTPHPHIPHTPTLYTPHTPTPHTPHTTHQVHSLEEDMLNIDKLEEGLMKFQKNQKNIHKELSDWHHDNQHFKDKAKELQKQIQSNQEITFKCIKDAEDTFESKHHHKEKKQLIFSTRPLIQQEIQKYHREHKRSVEEIDFSKTILHHSHSYDLSHQYHSYRTQPNFNEYSSLSYQPHHQRTSFERSYLHNPKKYQSTSWSTQELVQNQTTDHTHKKAYKASNESIQQKYLKHVKSKDRHFKPTSERSENYSNKHSEGQGFFHREDPRKDDIPTPNSKITYEELRSLLRTDL